MQSERRFSAFLGVVVTAPRARGYSAFSANYCRCVAHRSSRTRLQRVFRKLLSLCCTPLLAHAVTARFPQIIVAVLHTAPRARGYSAFSANYCRCVAHRSSRTRLQRVFRKLLSLCCTPLLTHAVTAFGDAPTLAECRPKFISVTAWRVRFRERSTSFIRFNPGENCYNQRPSFRSLHGGRDSGSVQPRL
jgi:hypothetical protein